MTLLASRTLRLRALEPEDLDLLNRVENDTDLWPFGVTNVPYSKFVLKRYLTETRYDLFADGQLRLIMERLGDSRVPVGMVDLMNFDPRHLRAEVGIVVLPEFRHQGVGTETIHLLESYCRSLFNLHQLYAIVASDNEPALSLFRSAGFGGEMKLPEWLARDGGFLDAVFLQKILEGRD